MCGNQLCEFGEQCTTTDCANGCPDDCPSFVGRQCPLGLSSSGVVMQCSGRGDCLPYVGTCSCDTGYMGNNCSSCADKFLRVVVNGPCIMIPGSQTSCSDGVKNGNELGVDCGGPNCPPCPSNRMTPVTIAALTVSVVCGVGIVAGSGLYVRRATKRLNQVGVVRSGVVTGSDGKPTTARASSTSPRKRNVKTQKVMPAPVVVHSRMRASITQWLRRRSNGPDEYMDNKSSGTADLAVHSLDLAGADIARLEEESRTAAVAASATVT